MEWIRSSTETKYIPIPCGCRRWPMIGFFFFYLFFIFFFWVLRTELQYDSCMDSCCFLGVNGK